MKAKEKELVTLREKPMKNGGSSLFLDYTFNGLRRKEYLKMYLVPERGRIEKLQNIETMKAAKVIKARRTIELQNGEAGIRQRPKDVLLVTFLEQQRDHYLEIGKTEYGHTIAKIIAWLKIYNHNMPLQDVDKDYLLDFFSFARKGVPEKDRKPQMQKGAAGRRINLATGLSEGTIRTFYSTLGTLFNNAIREKLITRSPIMDMSANEKPKRPESEREYLTMDEIQKLIKARCGNENVKKAFLFSCFTGLRLGDIEDLTWDKIRDTATGQEVATRMNKTRAYIYVPLSENAKEFLPKYGPKKGKIWNLPSRNEINSCIRYWVKRAGIRKRISYHCSRHTYATLLLTYGVDIYTVSKLLGHSDVSVTQIYAKVIDRKKVEAVNLIPKL